MAIYKTVLLGIIAYFIGSFSLSYLITRKLIGKDIRNIGVKNAGALNVFLNLGLSQALLVGVTDCLKTLLIVVVGQAWGLDAVHTIIAASFGIIGHCFPIYYQFSGGRGAASTIGIFIYFIPLELFISLIPSALIGFRIKRLGMTPILFIALAPIIAYIHHQPDSLVFATMYITLLMGTINIILKKRRT